MASHNAQIPVRNWWHMLLYAWELVEFKDRFDGQVEDAPDLRALLTSILVLLTKHQIRRGLRGDYVVRSEELRGVRGRIDFAQTLHSMAIHRGRLHCEYEEFILNVPRNQIIRSTLGDSLRRGFTSVEKGGKKYGRLVSDVEALLRMLHEIDRVRVTRRLITSQLRQLGRNEREYKLMLKICEMLQDPLMPRSDSATDMDFVDWLQERVHDVFERFVANFYKWHLPAREWNVSSQVSQKWNVTSESEGSIRLPGMQPDIVLTRRGVGKQRIVIDTKWYKSPVSQHFGNMTVHSGNLYQMYAYLASQDHLDRDHPDRDYQGDVYRMATGILLYGQTASGAQSFQTQIDAHPFRVATLNLDQDWQAIESDLLSLVNEVKENV